MKKTMKKILALVLTMLMLLSVAAPVFANTAATLHGDAKFVHTKANLEAQGMKYTEISKHVAEFCSDSTYTVYQCECGEYFADDITPAKGQCDTEVTKPATCAEEGVAKCKVCGYEHKIAKTTDHEYVAEIPCGEPGQKTNEVCKICGDKKENIDVAENHEWDITVTKEPECNVLGEALYECTKCGYTKTVSIKADPKHVGHNWVYGTAQEGKCFNDETGSTQPTITAGYYCADCKVAAEKNQIIIVDGKEVENTTVYSVTETEHKFEVQTTISYDATCTTAGFKFSGCIACGFMKTPEMTPARGHKWDREGADPLDLTKYTPDATLSVKCDAANGTHGKDVYLILCTECNENIKITVDHSKTLEMNKVVAPTCVDEGYTCNYCATCDEVFNKSNVVPANPDNHVYFASWAEANAAGQGLDGFRVTTDPTCTTPGVARAICKHCLVAYTENQIVPATIHNYFELDANGNIAYDDEGNVKLKKEAGYYTYDCLNGVEIYTCNDPACKDDAEGHVLKVAIPNWDYNNPEMHIHGNNPAWLNNPIVEKVGDCTTDRVIRYDCAGHSIYINLGKNHQIDKSNPDSYIEKSAPDCTKPGHVGYENCLNPDCDYETGNKNGVIKELGHLYDEKTYVEPVDPTCTEDGTTGYGKCTREKCTHTFGFEKEEDRVIPALGHTHVLIDDVNADAFNGSAWAITCTKYAYEHYICKVCNAVEGEKWELYVAATGHDLEYATPDDEPTCSEVGKLTCQNPDCGLGYVYTEIVKKVPHTDKDGKAIECLTEDFYCYVCCEPKFENGEFTGEYAKDKLNWKESHYEVVTTIPPHVCTEYHYILHVCDKCKVEWTVGEFGLNEHDTENVKYNVLEAPIDFLKPGVREVLCGNAGCTYVIRTEEFGLGVQLSFEFDNALVPGAAIVNSGYLAVKVYTNAYKQMVHSVDFSFGFADSHYFDLTGNYSSDIFTFEEVVVEDQNSPFYGMFFAAQTGNTVNVYGTVQNDANGNTQNVELDGADQYLVTLIFKVADDANLGGTIINQAIALAGTSVVNTVEGDAINSAFAGLNVPTVGTVLGPVDDNKTPDDKTDDMPFIFDIEILGDVNGDATLTNGSVASAVDVNKIRDLIAKGEYLAQADMDKDGAITVADFEYLAVYHVGGMTYAELCMLPEVPQAPVVTPSCPCCP